MNNNQFRKLVMDTPARQNESSQSARPSATPSAFGTKKSSFMPMTPRTVKGGIDVDFARQVRERNAALQPAKKFKSHAPRGVKYAAGYTDRAKAREDNGGEDDSKAARIKALEEQMKLGQIPQETFEALRDEITGGDVGSTHLVKGLDRRLLERVRRGEDVLGSGDGDQKAKAPPDVDEELDKLGEQEVQAVQKEKAEKKGTMAPPPPVAGKKRSRNEIMAELKAQREAAAQAKAASTFDERWRKVGEKQKSRIEIDHRGREVLITVDEDGVVKKKVRKASAATAGDGKPEAVVDMPDMSKPVLGADASMPAQAPETAPAEEEDDDDDIFEGVGTEYNPFGNDVDDDDDDSDEEVPAKPVNVKPPEPATTTLPYGDEEEDATSKPGEATEPKTVAAKRNYFGDTLKAPEEGAADHFAGIQNVLKKASNLDASRSEDVDDDESTENRAAREARLKKRAAMLAQQDRDLDDMDMGFGSSRYDDEAEAEEEGGKKVRLSEWKGGAGGGDDEGREEGGKGGGGGEKRKRKPKKRKGDVNNAADIMRVIEGRKAGGDGEFS